MSSFILGGAIGFSLGSMLVGWAWNESEKKAVEAGFLVIKNVLYSITTAQVAG